MPGVVAQTKPRISGLMRPKQEDCHEFQSSLIYKTPCLKKGKEKKKKERKEEKEEEEKKEEEMKKSQG